MEDRQINPDSFYEKESEETETKETFCLSCGDDFSDNDFIYQESDKIGYCNYCKQHFLGS